MIQVVKNDKIGLGGGNGFGLWIDDDLLHGSSMSCETFDNPCLSKIHDDNGLFEIANLEVWTLTSSLTLEDAEKMELMDFFVITNMQ